jgi:hypothetical protein
VFVGAAVVSPAASSPLSGNTWVATPNGLVGTQQTVILRAPKLAGQAATITFSSAASGTNAGSTSVNSAGFGYLNWTPNLPGTWTVTATSGGATVDTATITVSAMPTVTTLLAPGEVENNAQATLTAQVKALSGAITPSGTITVRNQFQSTLATGTLSPTSTPGLASASIAWTPTTVGQSLTATYTPATAAFGGSTSPAQLPVVAGPQAVSLQMPPVIYVGAPTTVSAVINSIYQTANGGSVAFNLNTQGIISYPMGGSRPIANGVGSTTWTPTQTGVQTVGVSYSSANFSISETDTQVVTVQPAPTADTITVTPAGSAAWGPGVVGALTAGSSVALTPTARSGNPVTLNVAGPCAIDGGTVTVLGAGTCAITATSVGNGSTLGGTQATYTINVQAAPKKPKKR